MKKALLLLFILLQVNLFSQELEPIVNQAKRWNVLSTSYEMGEDPPGSDLLQTFSMRVGDEVVVNGQNYHQIIKNGFLFYDYFIRENSSHQVYLYHSNVERLLYDFNLEVGDIISLYNEYDDTSYDYQVDNVSVEFRWEQNRKKIELSTDFGLSEVWYEGIGSIKGLIFSGDWPTDYSRELLCYFEDYDNFHQNSDVCNTSSYPFQDVAYFNENTFVLDHFLLDNSTIEVLDGEYTAAFVSNEGSLSNNVVEFNIGGMCGNITSASVLVNTDSSLSILNRGGTTLAACNPIDYPNGDNQEGRFFDILTGFFMYPNPDEYLPIYYEKSNDNTQLTMWVHENEKLVFNVSERLGIADKELKNQFTIFPNPVKDRLTIQTEISDYNVEIFSVLGKQIRFKNGLINQSTLDISSFKNGIYFLKISNEQGSFSLKFVKN